MNIAVDRAEETQERISGENTKEKSNLINRIKRSIVWIKVTRWEFWPFWVVYFPMFFYWMWITIRTRSFFFFTAANPGMEFGGLLGGSKYKILQRIPAAYIPKTYQQAAGISKVDFLNTLKTEGLKYPFILKPEVGERGFLVELISNERELDHYLTTAKVDFMVQEYINYPIELGVFYYRHPGEQKGTVSSVVMKELLSVKGDGQCSVQELMQQDERAKLYVTELVRKRDPKLKIIPLQGEKVQIVPIGNHCRGTTFFNANHLINDQLIQVFDSISQQIDGYYFGRYDLRCKSLEDLYNGNGIKILELNGANSEPAHIYHPGNSILNGYRDILFHLKVLKKISLENHQFGVPYLGFWDGVKELAQILKYSRLKRSSSGAS